MTQVFWFNVAEEPFQRLVILIIKNQFLSSSFLTMNHRSKPIRRSPQQKSCSDSFQCDIKQ